MYVSHHVASCISFMKRFDVVSLGNGFVVVAETKYFKKSTKMLKMKNNNQISGIYRTRDAVDNFRVR